MKQKISFVVYMIILMFYISAGNLFAAPNTSEIDNKIEVILIATRDGVQKHPHVLAAYKSVLEEEGVPFRVVDPAGLMALKDILPHSPAIIFPDELNKTLPKGIDDRIRQYIFQGGHVLIGHDAGTRDSRDFYMKSSVFADLLGLNYIIYDRFPENAFSNGYIRLTDGAASRELEISPGKTDAGHTLVGYQYGPLIYPFTRSVFIKRTAHQRILASIIDEYNDSYPVVMKTDYGKGSALFVGTPLGYAKCNSDDLLIRSVLRYFLFRLAGVPHIMPTPSGIGGIVFNWHIDSNTEWVHLPLFQKAGYFRDTIRYSNHITAGPFFLTPDDRDGFDADNRGRKYVEMILPYGTIGSHGGWGHNWFAFKVDAGEFGEPEIELYIRKNNESLERITGKKVTEYSAPMGVHPQPVATRVLERLGVVAYYYPGDSGSAPNRTFYRNSMVSPHVIAFPININGDAVSLYEMRVNKYPGEKVIQWMNGMADFVSRNRAVRLIYSHPNDFVHYPKELTAFLDYAETLIRDGKMRIESMTYYAQHLLKVLKTRHSFTLDGKRLMIRLSNPDGLKDITVAVPKDAAMVPDRNKDVQLVTDAGEQYHRIVITGDVHEKVLYFDYR